MTKLKQRFFFYLIAILFFFCVNHYNGIVVDAVLYTLQVIHMWSPERFLSEPAFMFGNQDTFSLFSPIYGLFIKVLGAAQGAKILCIVGQMSVAVSVTILFERWLKKFHLCFVTLPLVLLFFTLYAYGELRNEMWLSVKMIEPYVVARVLSAGLATIGLAFFFDTNKWLSLIWFLLGTLIHPLTAGWFLPLWVFFHYKKTVLPIVTGSLFVPLTIFIGKSPFDAFSPEWLPVAELKSDVIMFAFRIFGFVAFFALVAKKFTVRPILKKFSWIMAVVSGIALYWFLAGGIAGHIFLFQVQTFRIEWLCVVCILPLQTIIGFEKYMLFKRRKLQFWDYTFVGISIAFWLDSIYLDFLLTILFLIRLFLQNRRINILKVATTILFIVLFGVSIYCVVFLHQQRYPQFYMNYTYLVQNLLCVLAALSCFIAYWYPKSRVAIITCLIISLGMSVYCEDAFTRTRPAFAPLLMSLVLISVYAMPKLKYTLICVMAFFAAWFYDLRWNSRIVAEDNMEQFVKHPPFASVSDYGKVLYSVGTGGFRDRPRFFFLTGAYFDDMQEFGELFFEKQKKLLIYREKLLYYGSKNLGSQIGDISRIERKDKILQKLSNPDTLRTRFLFLCKEREITHLATDVDFDEFAKEDSLYMPLYEKSVFLYPCKNGF